MGDTGHLQRQEARSICGQVGATQVQNRVDMLGYSLLVELQTSSSLGNALNQSHFLVSKQDIKVLFLFSNSHILTYHHALLSSSSLPLLSSSLYFVAFGSKNVDFLEHIFCLSHESQVTK